MEKVFKTLKILPADKPWWSARWWLTIMCGLGFLWCIYARQLPPEAIATILATVILSYFNRGDRQAVQAAAGPEPVESPPAGPFVRKY